MENTMTITECVETIGKLKEIMYTCTDRPMSVEYKAIENTILNLCKKIENFKVI